jgi:hypothetical protein
MLKAKAKEAAHRITVGEDKAYDSTDHVANTGHGIGMHYPPLTFVEYNCHNPSSLTAENNGSIF